MKQVSRFFLILLVITLPLSFSGFCVPILKASPDTFGKTDVGSSSTTIIASWKKIASRFEASGSGNITEVSWYGKVSKNSTCYAVVYANNASDYPSDLLGTSDPLTVVNTTVQWYHFSFSAEVAIAQNTKYWLGVIFHAYSPTYYYDPGGSHQWVEKTDVQPPEPLFGEPDSIQDREMSIYATFTPSDTVPPSIEILSPDNKTYTASSVPLTFTVDEATSWIGYSLDGQMNETISGNTTIADLSDGTHTITVYANDTAGNMGYSDTVYFSITVPPSIEILSPDNKTYTTSSVPLSFTVDEAASWIGYSLDGQANLTITGNTTLTGLSVGVHSLVVYVGDIAGNIGSSDTVYFTIQITPIDTTPPSISIVSPENKTYDTTDIPLTFTLDESVSWMAYSLDGQANVTITGNTTLSGLSDGSHSLTVYATDIAGNTGDSGAIYFSIETQQAEPFPTWIVATILIIAVAVIALLIYFTKLKKKPEKAK